MPRPGEIKEIDYEVLDKLCELQATGEEIAGYFSIDYDTLNTRIKEKTGMPFSDYFNQKKGNGKISLRRLQWQKAQSGDSTMLIWLGKNMLEQKDNHNVGIDGNGLSININIKKASDEDAESNK